MIVTRHDILLDCFAKRLVGRSTSNWLVEELNNKHNGKDWSS